MSDEDLLAFVMGYCDGRVFTSAMLGSQLAQLGHVVFIPLALGAADGLDPTTLGLIWEWRDADGQVPGRAINGFPMFTSCRIMHKLDVARAQVAIDAEMKRRKEVKL